MTTRGDQLLAIFMVVMGCLLIVGTVITFALALRLLGAMR